MITTPATPIRICEWTDAICRANCGEGEPCKRRAAEERPAISPEGERWSLMRIVRQAQIKVGEMRLCGDMEQAFVADAIIAAGYTRPASTQDANELARELARKAVQWWLHNYHASGYLPGEQGLIAEFACVIERNRATQRAPLEARIEQYKELLNKAADELELILSRATAAEARIAQLVKEAGAYDDMLADMRQRAETAESALATAREAGDALNALITRTQENLNDWLGPDNAHDERECMNTLLEMFDGPRQREIQSAWRNARAK